MIDQFIQSETEDESASKKRSQSIEELQKDITEMSQMFKMLDDIVVQQSQQLNIISDQILSAKIKDDDALTQLSQTKKHNDSRNYSLVFGGSLLLIMIGGPTLLGIKTTCVIATLMGINYLNK